MTEPEFRRDSYTFEVKCPECGNWLYAETFLQTGQCVNCYSEYSFNLEQTKAGEA